MGKIRKKISKVGKDLTEMQEFLEGYPADIRAELQRQLQKAFEAGCMYNELQNIPQSLPVDEAGAIVIGPALRYHIMETRRIYQDVDQLREIVATIFDKKSQDMLRAIMRAQEERMSGTEGVQLEL